MWIAIFVVFMSLLVIGVIVACVVYSKMDNGNTIADKTLGHIKEESVEEYEEMVDDNDKFLDDMIFMDLIDED